MKGICHIWSRGRLISPSMPVGDDWYLNLDSQKRPPGRNLGEHRLVRRSGATSRGTVVLAFCLRMRSFPRTEFIPYSWEEVFFFQLFVFILGANERKSGLLRKLPDWQEPVLSVLRTRAYGQTSPAGQFSHMVSALGFKISRYSRS